jgi:hypothetical protein
MARRMLELFSNVGNCTESQLVCAIIPSAPPGADPNGMPALDQKAIR